MALTLQNNLKWNNFEVPKDIIKDNLVLNLRLMTFSLFLFNFQFEW